MRRFMRRRWLWLGWVAAIGALLFGGTVFAQRSGEIYRLGADEVIADDFYYGAGEIIIDGTVKGDLVVAAGYVEVNGTVEGDLIAAAGSVVINGTVQDDARVAGAGVEVRGAVGDDLFAGAGGDPATPMFTQAGTRSIPQGLRIYDTARIGGNLNIGAGTAEVAGTVTGDLNAGAGQLNLAGNVGGDADLSVSALQIADTASIEGTLTYTAPAEASIPAGAAGSVQYAAPAPEEPQAVGQAAFPRLLQIVLALLGFLAIGWLALRFAGPAIDRPVTALAFRPGRAALYGLAASLLLIFVPLLSALLVFAVILFFGWAPGVAMFLFLFTALSLIWVLSPLITGPWLGYLFGRLIGREFTGLAALLIGVAAILLLGLVPVLGWLVYLFSFIFAIGGIILAQRGEYDAPVSRLTPAHASL